jgi:hypothetical protein
VRLTDSNALSLQNWLSAAVSSETEEILLYLKQQRISLLYPSACPPVPMSVVVEIARCLPSPLSYLEQ